MGTSLFVLEDPSLLAVLVFVFFFSQNCHDLNIYLPNSRLSPGNLETQHDSHMHAENHLDVGCPVLLFLPKEFLHSLGLPVVDEYFSH